MSKTYRVGKHTFHILFPDLLRPLSKAEEGRLRKSIRKDKVHVPVVVDEDGGVIDGSNRVRLAAEVGLVHIPVDVRKGLTSEQKVELAHLLNDTRRHLSARDREAAEKELVRRMTDLRSRGKSEREIAEETGASKTQVHRVLGSCPGGPNGPPGQAAPSTVTGQDGKVYPAESLTTGQRADRDARMAELVASGKTTREVAEEFGVSPQTVSAAVKRRREAEAAPAGDDPFAPATTPGPPPVTLDDLGIPVQPHAAAAFAGRHLFDELLFLLKEAGKKLSELVDSPAGGHLLKRSQWVESGKSGRWVLASLENASREIKACRPSVTDCPYAYNEHQPHGDECPVCKNLRWMPPLKAYQIPPTMLRAMTAHYGVSSEGDE
jgi:transposase